MEYFYSVRKDPSPPQERQNVSFKFTKTTTKAISGNKWDDVTHKEKDYVVSVVKNEIKSTYAKEDKKELVIPLIKKNNWRGLETSEETNDVDQEAKLRELAVKELLKETVEENEKWEKREFTNYTITIPLIMQNQVPRGYETEDRMDVSLRPSQSTLEDYEKVPVEDFGRAMLRGMGWKEGKPIGANSKKCVDPVEVKLRPKGLGLGADPTAGRKHSRKSGEEKLELVKGAYFCVVRGTYKGQCGQVLSLDEENARVIGKLNNDEKVVTLPEFYIEVLSKKEYEKESRVINRASYVDYKKEQEKKRESDRHSRDRKHKSESHSRSPKRKSGRSRSPAKKRKHSRDRSPERRKTWVRPQLRVRLIDEKYKKGKYFNEKMVVMDVLSLENCTCKTEENRYLDNISSSMLETVIPRNENSYVMIVSGKYEGELGTILKKEKSKCVATVQLLSNRDKALKLDYDTICEFVGDVSDYD